MSVSFNHIYITSTQILENKSKFVKSMKLKTNCIWNVNIADYGINQLYQQQRIMQLVNSCNGCGRASNVIANSKDLNCSPPHTS